MFNNKLMLTVPVITVVMLLGATFIMIGGVTQGDGQAVNVTLIPNPNSDMGRWITHKITLSGLPSGFDIENGNHYAWCIEEGSPIYGNAMYTPDLDPYNGMIYYSYDPNLPEKWETIDWHAINYVLHLRHNAVWVDPSDSGPGGVTNNRAYAVLSLGLGGTYTSPIDSQDYTELYLFKDVVQDAIYYFTNEDTSYTGSRVGTRYLIDQAEANADSWTPDEEEMVAWLIDLPDPYEVDYDQEPDYYDFGIQDLMIEGPYDPEEENGDPGARTIGYWKTHEEVWEDWIPGEDSYFYGYDDQDDLIEFFPSKGKESKNMETWEMVRAQLLGVELNFYFFSDEGGDNDWDFDYSNWEWDEEDIYYWMDEAGDFLDIYWGYDWDTNSMDYDWDDYKDWGSEIIDALDDFNNMGDEVFEEEDE